MSTVPDPNTVIEMAERLSLSDRVRLIEKLAPGIAREAQTKLARHRKSPCGRTTGAGEEELAEFTEELAEFLRGLERRGAEPHEAVIQLMRYLDMHVSAGKRKSAKSLRGLWKGADVQPEDITAARREMWSRFPRSDI